MAVLFYFIRVYPNGILVKRLFRVGFIFLGRVISQTDPIGTEGGTIC